MKNRLKGVTLLETLIYIGLFSIVIIMILSFMLSTQESTLKNQRRALLYQSREFVIQHINHTLKNSSSVLEFDSVFEDTNGVLELSVGGENKGYVVTDSTLEYNGEEITPANVTVENFYLEEVRDKEDVIVGVRVSMVLRSNSDSNLSEDFNMLFTLR